MKLRSAWFRVPSTGWQDLSVWWIPYCEGQRKRSSCKTMIFTQRANLWGGVLLLAHGLITSAALGGTGDENWDARFEQPISTHGSVSHMVVSDKRLYVAGSFIKAGGDSATNIAKWDGTNWSALGSGLNGTIRSLSASGSNVYVSGNFVLPGRGSFGLISWNGAAWTGVDAGDFSGSIVTAYRNGVCSNLLYMEGTNRTLLGEVTNGWISTVAAAGDNLYVGGIFASINGLPITNMARWDGTNWSGLGGGIDYSVSNYSSFFRLAADDTALYAAGRFTNLSGVSVTNIAKWDGTNWSGLGPGLSFPTNEPIWAFAVSGQNVYAFGRFGSDQANSWNLAHWHGGEWTMIPWKTYPPVAMAADAGGLYVGEKFTSLGDKSVNGIGYWTGTEWDDLAGGLVDTGSIETMALHGNDVIVGGNFYSVGGLFATNL